MDLLFTSASIKRFLYLTLTTTIAFVFFMQIDSASSIWLVWVLLLSTLITAGVTWQKRLLVIAATGVLVALVVFISGSLATSLLLLSAYLLTLTVLCTYFSGRFLDYSYQFFLINLFAILACGFAPSELENLERSIFVFIGFVVGLFAQIIWWPISAKDNLYRFLQTAIFNLKQLNSDIFTCFFQVEYSDNIYLFERRIHEAKNKFIQSIGFARKAYKSKAKKMSEDERSRIEESLRKTDKLFDILLDCAQLRRRVSDHTIFLLCVEELKTIAVEIDNALTEIMRKLRNRNYQLQSLKLSPQITRLEDSYQNILRVSAREPLVFLLFIFSLKELENEITAWQKELTR